MPYVDQGEPKPPTARPPIVPLIAVAIAMGAGFGSFVVLYNAAAHQILPVLIVGPLVGLAIRMTNKGGLPKAGLIAVVATLIATLVGYAYRHAFLITWYDGTGAPMRPQPGVGNAFQWLLSADLVSLLCIGMSAYFAFAIGAAFPTDPSSPQQIQQS